MIYLFFLEALISAWYLKEITTSQEVNTYMILIILLGYLCLKVTYYIFEHKNWSRVILLIIIGLILVSMHLYYPIIYFMMFVLLQLILRIAPKYHYISFVCLFLVQFNHDYTSFLLISILTYMIIHMSFTSKNRMKKLILQNEQLEEGLVSLQEKKLLMSHHEIDLAHTTRLEERDVIAQKLHDELGHTLSGSTLQLEAAILVMDSNPEKSKEILKTVIAILRNGSDSIRKILKDIKPEVASINIQSIKTLASEIEEKSHIKMHLIYDSDVSAIDNRYWKIIHQNIKETMTNMMKYSKATRCTIQFEKLNKTFKVSIIDNGKGCMTIKEGLGIRGMSDRLSTVDGKLILDGSNGFSTIMLFPIGGKHEVSYS